MTQDPFQNANEKLGKCNDPNSFVICIICSMGGMGEMEVIMHHANTLRLSARSPYPKIPQMLIFLNHVTCNRFYMLKELVVNVGFTKIEFIFC